MITRPDQTLPGIVTHLGMCVEEFGLEILQGVIVQRKLALEGAICDALALTEDSDGLVEHRVEVHPQPLRSRGMPAVSPVVVHLSRSLDETLCSAGGRGFSMGCARLQAPVTLCRMRYPKT